MQYGEKATKLTEDGKAADIPTPDPDPEWVQEQTTFRVAQTAELQVPILLQDTSAVQSVREAFARKGQRMPMATIERALTLPRERTFEECMSAMQTANYMLKKVRTHL